MVTVICFAALRESGRADSTLKAALGLSIDQARQVDRIQGGTSS
jgi:hypothetical protein